MVIRIDELNRERLELRRDLKTVEYVRIPYGEEHLQVRAALDAGLTDESWVVEVKPVEERVADMPAGRGPLARAVALAVRSSWTLQERISRDLLTSIDVNLRVRRGASGNREAGVKPYGLGELIRPVLCEHRPIAELHRFQVEGQRWLKGRKRAILADDMGLGKTLQVLAAARELIYEGTLRQVVVVSPKTLVPNWTSEIRKWTPDLTWAVAFPWNNKDHSREHGLGVPAHIILCHYEALRSALGADNLLQTDQLLILDEAHRVRNRGTQTAAAIRELRGERLWALTGTPLERDVGDVATLLALLDPRRWSSTRLAEEGPDAVRGAASAVTLRRRKADVLTQLPEVVEREDWLEMGPKERRAYELVRKEFGHDVRPAQTLRLIHRLLDVCNGGKPELPSAKIERVSELINEVKAAGEKAIVFSHTLAPLRRLHQTMLTQAIDARLLLGEMSAPEREEAVADFRRSKECSALLASLGVGAEGLTLVEANHAIFLNRWWNPSVNRQARDRIVRIGQRRTVFVHYIMCVDTVDEAMEEVISKKEVAFRDIVDGLARM